MVLTMFSWGSAAIDWCEVNFAHSYYIAEFFNTISNLPLIVLPLMGLHLLRPYFNQVNRDAKIVFYLLFAVGVSSAYFHATLSLFGQLLDELSILWIIAAGFCTWFPGMDAMPLFIKSNVSAVRKATLALAVGTTLLSIVQPAANSYVLMTFGPPVLTIMFGEVKRNKDPDGSKLVKLSFYSWLISVCLWASDRMMCNTWRRVGFPYLHAMWHLGIAISSYSACVLFPYLETLNRSPWLKPKISYLPGRRHPWVPYLTLTTTTPTATD